MRKLLSLVLLLLLTLSLSAQQGGMGPGPGNKTYTAGETNFVNDSFTADSAGVDEELSLHTTGELGATWTEHSDATYGASVLNGTLNRVYATGSPSAYYASGTPPSADYCVEGVIHVASIVSANSALAWRIDTAANTMMIFQLNNGTGWRIRKIVAGVQTTIGSEDTTTNIPGVGESRTMKACSSGNTHTAYINGTLLGTVGGSDSSITAAGQAGIRFSGTFSSTTGYHFDSFRAFTP